jgi:hypothetical protein
MAARGARAHPGPDAEVWGSWLALFHKDVWKRKQTQGNVNFNP